MTRGTGTEVDTTTVAAWPCRTVCRYAAKPFLGRPDFQGAGQSLEIRVSRIGITLGVPPHALGEDGLARAEVAADAALGRAAVADRSGVALGVDVLGWSDCVVHTRASSAEDLSANAVLD